MGGGTHIASTIASITQRQTFLDKLAGMVEPVAGAAALLGISRQRVLQLISAGDLQGRKIGRQYFVDALSLQARLESHPPKTRG